MKLMAVVAASFLTPAAILCAAQVTTSQYNHARTAATPNEKSLTPQNVNPRQFGKLGRVQGGTARSALSRSPYGRSPSPGKARTTLSSSPPSMTTSTPSTPSVLEIPVGLEA